MTPTRRSGTLSSGTGAAGVDGVGAGGARNGAGAAGGTPAGGAGAGHLAIGLAGGGGRKSSVVCGTLLCTGLTPVTLCGRSTVDVGRLLRSVARAAALCLGGSSMVC